jgi:hypothetical protein
MIVYPRSYWTSVVPRPLSGTNEFDGLPYFDDPPVGIEFESLPDEILYVYRNPSIELNRLRQLSILGTGHTDINYNYAISQNTEGVYVLRGGITKCRSSDNLRVLMLMGRSERATDIMKKNQDDFINQPLVNAYPINPMSLGDSDVHVFNLIEFLAERSLYKARNDGVYNMFVEHAVQKLQKDLRLTIDGTYSRWVINALENLDREYIGV